MRIGRNLSNLLAGRTASSPTEEVTTYLQIINFLNRINPEIEVNMKYRDTIKRNGRKFKVNYKNAPKLKMHKFLCQEFDIEAGYDLKGTQQVFRGKHSARYYLDLEKRRWILVGNDSQEKNNIPLGNTTIDYVVTF